ncbi:hypothetical protein B0H19DRAFT_1255392 [Mycena capillaripes]|nr:hypothetical protein B0H19DRAFT_1255392 [Mycena capillaripes]
MSVSLNGPGTIKIEGGTFNNVSGNMYQVFKFHSHMSSELAEHLPGDVALGFSPLTTGAVRPQRRARRENSHPYGRPSVVDSKRDPQDLFNSPIQYATPLAQRGVVEIRSSIDGQPISDSDEEKGRLHEGQSTTATEEKKVFKQRRNTLAVRHNRQRRLTSQQQQLQETVNLLTQKK